MDRSFEKVVEGALAAMCALALTLPAAPPALADQPDAPDVARISTVDGNVDVRRADSNASYAAAPNAPVTVGDYIETQGDGRSEVQFDGATVLRVAPQSQLRFTHLTPSDHEFQLAQGTVELRLFRGTEGRPVVETPSAQVRPDEAGRYRVTVDGNGDTVVTVRSGRADISVQGDNGPQTLTTGQAVRIAAAGNPAQIQGIGPVAYDSFDGWSDARDTGWSHVRNWSYVDNGIVGANDLSDYGQWTNDANYGQVWAPADESADWTPYSDGRWVWESDYGWTWIDNQPWGYAPYHYGRWFRSADRGWCWTPQGYGPAPYAYAPAVVGFFGLGAGIGISFTIGDVGWVPLAPGEAYNPWYGNGYGPGARFYDRRDLARSYRNARYSGAALAVSGRNFAAGNFAHVLRVRPNQYGHAVAFRGVVPVVPTARNLAFSGRALTPARGPVVSRRFGRMAAPAVAKLGFAKQRTAVAATARKQYPIARGVGFTGPQVARASGSRTSVARPNVTRSNAARTNVAKATAAQARPASVWDRFAKKPAAKSGETAVGRSRANGVTAGGTHSGTAAARHTASRPAAASKAAAYVAPHAAVAHAHPAPAAHTYAAPTHAYAAPATHAYVAPVRHTYVAPAPHHVAAPAARTYAAPRPPVSHAAAPAPHRAAAPAPHPAPAAAHPAPAAPAHDDHGHR